MREPEKYLTVSEVVARTGFAERTVRAMIAEGRLQAVRPAGLRVVRIPEQAVTKLMRGPAPGGRR